MDSVRIKKLEKSEIEIMGSLSFSSLEKFKDRAVKDLSKNIRVDGFRKGHIPENILISKLGSFPILEKMSNLAMNKLYPKILIDNKIKAIGMPEIQITKLAEGNPVEYKIKTAVMPKIEVCDYKEISKKNTQTKELIIVEEKEIDNVLLEMRRQKAFEKINKMDTKGNDTRIEDYMPKEDDDFAISMGDYKSLIDLKSKIKEGLHKEKELREKNKRGVEILEKIIEKSTIDVPNILIENELDKMLLELNANVSRMGLSIDVYLSQIKKTIDELKDGWKSEAEKRVKFGLILKYIVEKENIIPKKHEVDKEVENILKLYKDADITRVRPYVENQIANEKVYKLLENQ